MSKAKSVLIITYGRSGSTLLMGVLNSLDGYLIRGENSNFFFGLYQAYKSQEDNQKHSIPNNPTNPWFGAPFIGDQELLNDFSNLAKKYVLADKNNDPNIQCYGFKEIRYAEPQIVKCFDDYLDFLSLIFPDCHFIFNTRNLADVMKSKWWTNMDESKAKAKILQAEECFRNYSYNHRDQCFQITYEDILAQNKNLQNMIAFLGEKYDQQSINQVLNVKHSY